LKTFKNLYPQITSFENLRLAFKKAARGKRGKADVAAFEYDLEGNLLALQEELQSGEYQPGEYFNFRIRDPKPRLISAAPFRDRVVHHALCHAIEPIWERKFIHDSYACRVGKGTHAALDRVTEFSRRYRYVLQCDIQHFFPNMDHAILYRELSRTIACAPTLALCKKILDSGAGVHAGEQDVHYFPGDDLFTFTRARGLPIGNLTSQFWANVYLNPLDHFIKRELKAPGYVRYVDDFLLFSNSKANLNRCLERVIGFLGGLRLTLHETRAVVFPVRTGIPFLGWRIYPQHRRLRRHNVIQFQRRLAKQRNMLAAGRLDYERFRASLNSWIAHVEHGDTWGLRCSLFSAFRLPPFAVYAKGGRSGGGL
jgi:retron-type reverse transcriptase